MHPLVAQRNEALAGARARRRRAEDDLDTALRAEFDPARLRPATPADVVPGAVLWYPYNGPDGPDGTYTWSVVERVGADGAFMDEEGGSYPYLDRWHVLEAAAAPAVPEAIAAILAEDVRGDSREAWLLDTGDFLLIDEVHPAWWASPAWRLRMRQRRALRLFVPASEIDKLKRVELAFDVAKRGYEMADALRRHLIWIDELQALLKAEAGKEEVDRHRAREPAILGAAHAHAGIVAREAPERLSPIRTVPFDPPPPVVADKPRAEKAGRDGPKEARPGKADKPKPVQG